MLTTKVSGRADFDRFKRDFQEVLKNIDDVYCHEHSKLKTIYTDMHPSNPSKGGFICDYCNNPSSTMKFYSQILAEYSGIINQTKNSSDIKNTNYLQYKSFVENCLKWNTDVEDTIQKFLNLTDNFNSDFIPGIYTKVTAAEELMKLNEILKTITFNEQGRPIYESIGKHPEREKQYVKLANILIAFKGEKFDMNMVFSNSLKQYLIAMLANRMELIKKSNEFIKFLAGDFFKFIYGQENIAIDYDWLNTLNLTIFTDEEIRHLRASYETTINSQSAEITALKNKVSEYEIELANRKKMNSSLEIEINNLKALNQKWQIRIQQLENDNNGLVQAANDNEQQKQQLNALRIQYEKKLQELNDKNKELTLLIEGYLRDISNLKNQYSIIINEKTSITQTYEIKAKEYEKTLNALRLEFTNLKVEYEKQAGRLNGLNEIPELRAQINELILSRKTIIETSNQEKLALNANIVELERQINDYRTRIETLIVFESNSVILNQKVIELASALKNLENKFNNESATNQRLTRERDELLGRITTFTSEMNSYNFTIKSLREENENLTKTSSLYMGLLSDLKKQVSLNKTLEATVLNLQEKINVFNSRVAANELLIKNQLEIIRKYVEDKPIIILEEKDEFLLANKRETDLILQKIERLETNTLYKSIMIPTVSSSSTVITTRTEEQKRALTPVRTSVRNTVTNFSTGSNDNYKVSTTTMRNQTVVESGNFNINTISNRNNKLIYKINFSSDLLLNADNWDLIRNWIDSTDLYSNGIQPKLLYKATRDGFAAQEFQKRCYNIANTLIIAKTNYGKLIGGFTPLAWNVPDKEFKYLTDDTKKTFIFSCNNGAKYDLLLNEYAVCLSQTNGPIFGGGSDFEIVDNCNVKYNESCNIGHTFNYKKAPEEFFGDKKYLIIDYEVYQLL